MCPFSVFREFRGSALSLVAKLHGANTEEDHETHESHEEDTKQNQNTKDVLRSTHSVSANHRLKYVPTLSDSPGHRDERIF